MRLTLPPSAPFRSSPRCTAARAMGRRASVAAAAVLLAGACAGTRPNAPSTATPIGATPDVARAGSGGALQPYDVRMATCGNGERLVVRNTTGAPIDVRGLVVPVGISAEWFLLGHVAAGAVDTMRTDERPLREITFTRYLGPGREGPVQGREGVDARCVAAARAGSATRG